MGLTVKQHRMRADDEQFAQVPIAHLRDAPQLGLAAGRVLFGRQPEKGGELARASETGGILNGRRHCRGGDRAEPGNAHQPARRFILLRHLHDRPVKSRDRFVEIPQLHHERRQRLAHFKRDCLVAGLDQLGQFAGVSGSLRRDDADLGQVAAQAVQQLRSLRDQHLSRLVTHQRRLVLQRAHTDKPHRRPRHRLADCRRIRGVVLLPANIRLYISRRHHARVMAKLDQLARPVMRRPGGLKPHQATWQRSEKLQQLVAPDRFGDHDTPQSINAVDLKDVLGQIEPYGGDR